MKCGNCESEDVYLFVIRGEFGKSKEEIYYCKNCHMDLIQKIRLKQMRRDHKIWKNCTFENLEEYNEVRKQRK